MSEASTLMQATVTAFRDTARTCRTSADLEALRRHLNELAEAAMNAEYLGLQDCIMLMQQHLDDVAASGHLTDRQIRLLQEWPDRISAYLDGNGDDTSSEPLLALLGDAVWPAPLDQADAEVLRGMLVRVDSKTGVSALRVSLDALAESIRAIDDTQPETLRQTATELEQSGQQLGEAGETALQDCAVLLQQNLEDLAADGKPLTDTLKTLLTAWSGLVDRCLHDPKDENARRALIENLCHPQWPAALSEADAAVLYELFGIAPPATTETATGTDEPVADNVMPFPGDRTIGEPSALARLDASLARIEPHNPATIRPAGGTGRHRRQHGTTRTAGPLSPFATATRGSACRKFHTQ